MTIHRPLERQFTIMNKTELYAALVALCQSYGTTTGETYEKLHEAITTITPGDEDEDE